MHAVLTHEDVPGGKLIGIVIPDQPVLAIDRVRYHGEPVAIVAADDPEAARAAAAKIAVDYEVVEALTDPEPRSTRRRPGCTRRQRAAHVQIRHGDPDADGEVVVRGAYEVGMQDQAFLGPESGLAVPAGHGGVDLYIATQWLHVDRDQLAACARARRRIRCGSCWPASAARSARARTCRCRSTRACSPSPPGGR